MKTDMVVVTLTTKPIGRVPVGGELRLNRGQARALVALRLAAYAGTKEPAPHSARNTRKPRAQGMTRRRSARSSE